MKKTLLLLPFLLLLSACTVVGPGERGVRVSLGTVSEDPKPPGAYLWIPFIVGMQAINVQLQKDDIKADAASKDMQDVHAVVAVNWSLAPEDVVKTFKNIGDEDEVNERILRPAVNEVLKAATAKRTAEEILTQRQSLKKDIDDGLRERLGKYGIKFEDASVTNLSFSAGFSQAIEHKQIAEQQAKQAFYVAEKATQDAKAAVEKAKGTAESQRLMISTLTPAILQMKAIEKWDGKYPQVMGTGALPFINMNLGK